MQPAYYEDFKEIKKKIWSMLDDAVPIEALNLEFLYLFVEIKKTLMEE